MNDSSNINKPLVGREAIRFVDRQFRENGATMYFLSFVNKVPKPKETFASYYKFVNKSKNRQQKLAEYSDQLQVAALQRRIAAQRLIEQGKFDSLTIQQLFSKLPVRQIIPRSRKYHEVKQSMFIKPEDRSKDVHRLLAAIVSQPLICR